MLIDLHMHESTYSGDSFLQLKDIVNIAKQTGLDGICITDHDSLGIRDMAAEYAEQVDYPIFVGVEYFSLQGDIIAFGIEDIPKKRIPAQEFIDYVHDQNGVCFAAHPFRNNKRGLADNLFKVTGLDGVEAFNGSTDYRSNLKALEYCRQFGVQPLGVSDCHVKEKVGVYATWFPDGIQTMRDFIDEFKKGLCHPVGFIHGNYVNMLQVVDHLVPETCVIPHTIVWNERQMHI